MRQTRSAFCTRIEGRRHSTKSNVVAVIGLGAALLAGFSIAIADSNMVDALQAGASGHGPSSESEPIRDRALSARGESHRNRVFDPVRPGESDFCHGLLAQIALWACGTQASRFM